MKTLRSTKGEAIYRKHREKGLLQSLWDVKPLYLHREYRIIKNAFPYDRIHSESVILITNHPIDKAFEYAKEYAEKHGYHQVLWNTSLAQSVPDTVHLHILKLKE